MNRKDLNYSSSTRSTLLVSSMTMISRILGFVRIAVITAVFGAGGVADVINLTFNIPNNLRKLLAEGALSSAFIPVLSESLVKRTDGEEAKKIVRSILSFQMLILIPLCILVIIFARPLIGIVLSEFTELWQIELSTNLFKWFINYLLLISVSAVLMGVINSHKRFFIPSITPVLFSIFVILSILLFSSTMGPYSMVLGILLGGFAQILFQSPAFLKLGYDFRINFNFITPEFRKILKQWLPVVASSSVFTIIQIIAYRFSSGLEEGSASALTYAIVFWQLPMGIFASSITTVLFPKMSRQAVRDDIDGLRESIQHGIRFLLVFLVPSAIFLIVFGHHTIIIALQRGEFTAENTIMTAKVLSAYSLGLFSVGLFNFLQRFFYSIKNYRIPFIVALFTGIFDVILSIFLKETSLRVSGLALSNTIAFTTGALILLIMIIKKLDYIDGKRILKTFYKVILTGAIMLFCMLLYRSMIETVWLDGGIFIKIILFVAGIIICCSSVLIFYTLFRVEMVKVFLKRRRK